SVDGSPAETRRAPAGSPAPTQVLTSAPVIRLARDVFQQANRPHFTLMLASAPSAPIQLEVFDASGKVIRTERFVGRQGLNGINWDLRHNGPTLVALKTTPPENPHIWEEPRFQG